jgi:hypothetical protein
MSMLILGSLVFLLSCGDEEAEAAAAAEAAEKEEAAAAAAAANVVGDANVTEVYAREDQDNTWTFHVTVKHKDVNWDDYANGWDLVLPDGTTVKPDKFSGFTKSMRQPHVDKKRPNLRTQRGIVLPEGTATVTVRAHDKKGGWGGEEITLDLNQRFGENYSVKRKL